MAINCCKGCVPPKRTPTCKFDGTCNRYAEAKKKHDAEREAARKAKAISDGVYESRQRSARKVLRHRGDKT